MTDALVSTGWVAQHLGAPGPSAGSGQAVRVIEVTFDPSLYSDWHLPGALAINWLRDLIEEEDESSGKIPDPERFAALARRLGIHPDDTLVFYGDQGGRHAARAFWVFEYYRHAGALHLMDGGREQWQREGRPTSDEPAHPAPSGYPVPSGRRPELRATAEQIMAALRQAQGDKRDDLTVLDVRTRAEYDGADVRAARGGHIPGAIHVNWEDALNDDKTLKSTAELEQLYAAVPRDAPVAVHCQLGIRAAHTWFVLRHVLGYDRAANYDGSWQEWGNRDDTPVEAEPQNH
jgi:thiosulfate/3-mercaptopyruvate sulfurtransferase